MKNLLKPFYLALLIFSFNSIQAQIIEAFLVSPNPASFEISIYLQTSVFSRFDAKLYNVTGQEIDAPFTDSIIWPGQHSWEYDISFLENGFYFLELEASSGETTVAKFVKDAVVSLDEVANSKTVVFPNPVRNWLNIDAINQGVRLYDVQGKLVFLRDASTNRINVSGLRNGIYLLEVLDGLNTRISLVVED